jgi:ABC-type multidrug transport system, permease component
VNAMVPSIFMLLLCLIPAIMSAIAVVREKETGSIANFRSTPITRLEYLIGKQLPYIAVAMIAFFALLLIAIFIFHVPPKGPVPRPSRGNDRLCCCDRWVRRSDLLLHPNAGCSGLRDRDSFDRAGGQFLRNARAGLLALRRGEGDRPVVSLVLVSADFGRRIRQGARLVDLWRDIAAIALIALVFLAISLALLRKQEA